MKIIEPNVELWEQIDNVAHVCRCARVCYGKESGNNNALYESLETRKHLSMFRHETYYAVIPVKTTDDIIFDCLKGMIYCPYIDWVTYKGNLYIVTNGNFMRDIHNTNVLLYKYINDNQISFKEAINIQPIWKNLARYTFCVTTQISTSRELNRVSPNNIAEQSTRYVYEDGTICRPHWMTKEEADYLNTKEILDDDWIVNHCLAKRYIWTIDNSFDKYKMLVDAGLHRQDARGVLPLDTATVCAYTYSIKEWRAILDLRYYGIAGQPHPNAKIAAGMIREQLMELGYEFR